MKNNNGTRYTEEVKASIVKRMMPPNNESVGKLSEVSIDSSKSSEDMGYHTVKRTSEMK